ILSYLVFAVSDVIPGVFPRIWSVALSGIVMAISGTTWNVITVSMRQRLIPAELFGRVNSVYRFIGTGSTAFGALIGGQIAYSFGLRAEQGLGVYNLTKAAVIHLTSQLACELGKTRVVGIAPGLVKTLFASVLIENVGDKLASALPTKRLGEPQDIANLALFLCSDLASWITGETYVIDGGAGVRSGTM
ncbi:MAG: SDR family oxidoreductase, partial [Acidimicrobiaceae bacterium]